MSQSSDSEGTGHDGKMRGHDRTKHNPGGSVEKMRGGDGGTNRTGSASNEDARQDNEDASQAQDSFEDIQDSSSDAEGNSNVFP